MYTVCARFVLCVHSSHWGISVDDVYTVESSVSYRGHYLVMWFAVDGLS